jgi:hypothetical protein
MQKAAQTLHVLNNADEFQEQCFVFDKEMVPAVSVEGCVIVLSFRYSGSIPKIHFGSWAGTS